MAIPDKSYRRKNMGWKYISKDNDIITYDGRLLAIVNVVMAISLGTRTHG